MIIIDETMVDSRNRIITVKGKDYNFAKGMKGHNVTTIKGDVYIDGFQLVNGEWKKTFKGLFYKFR